MTPSEKLSRIRAKLDRLREKDRGSEVFGVSSGDFGHRYEEAPTLAESTLVDLETTIGARLPDEYRSFLNVVHGGGAGPGYGLARPQTNGPAGRFPFTREQALGLLERRRGDERFALLPRDDLDDVPGCVVLADQGCGWNDVLVVEGELRGTVWTVGEGWCPHARGVDLVGFLDWFEGWLDVHLAPGALTTDPMEVPSLPADTEGLNLSRKNLAHWPAGIDRLTKLRILVLDGNALTTVPDSLGRLERLERLGAGWNRIESLPTSIGRLGALASIMLKSNAIAALPGSFGELRSLAYLCLDFNALTRLPDSIGGLGALRELQLASNRISKLPDSIGDLAALEYLELSSNPIGELPVSVGRLGRLRSISLAQSHLTRLPDEIAALPSLRRVVLDRSQGLDVAQACEVLSRAPGLREVSLASLGLSTAPEPMLSLRVDRLNLAGNALPRAALDRIRSAMPSTEVTT